MIVSVLGYFLYYLMLTILSLCGHTSQVLISRVLSSQYHIQKSIWSTIVVLGFTFIIKIPFGNVFT